MPTLKGKSLGFLLVLLLLVYLITPSGCAGKKEAVKGPREVLSFYLDALIGGRVDEARQNLSSGGKNSTRIAAFAPGQSEEENFIRGQLAKKIHYVIKDITLIEGNAEAVVEITAPDYEKVIKDLHANLSWKELPAGSLEAHAFITSAIGRIIKKYQEKGIPMKSGVETFYLVNEAGGWKVDIDGKSGRRGPS